MAPPLSIVAVDSAKVGPFDLGTIVVRSAIEVNPRTAQVSVDSAASDPIPHILDGIPLHLRDVRVYIDRPHFTLNPTSCDPFSVASTLTGSAAPFTDPTDITATATVPFQASFCSQLPFAPRFALNLKGQTRHGGFPPSRRPSPRAPATPASPPPRSPCRPRSSSNRPTSAAPAPKPNCKSKPAARSDLRPRQATTPLLAEPMEGPVYLAQLPGRRAYPTSSPSFTRQGIRIVLDGQIDKYRSGIRATFEGLPDAPVSSFEMTIHGGKKGLLVNSADLCALPSTHGTVHRPEQHRRGAAAEDRRQLSQKAPRP